MKKGDKVIWRVSSGFCTQEWKGEVGAVRRGKIYVLFGESGSFSGGHWLHEDELIKEDA